MNLNKEQLSYIENILDWDKVYALIPSHYYLRGSIENIFNDSIKNIFKKFIQSYLRQNYLSRPNTESIPNDRLDPHLEPLVLELRDLFADPNFEKKIIKEIADQLSAWIPFLKEDEILQKAFSKFVPLVDSTEAAQVLENFLFKRNTHLTANASYFAYCRCVWSGFRSNFLNLNYQNLPRGRLFSLRIKIQFPLLDHWIAWVKKVIKLSRRTKKKKPIQLPIELNKRRKGFLKPYNIYAQLRSAYKQNKTLRKYNKMLSALRFVENSKSFLAKSRIGNSYLGKRLIETAHQLKRMQAYKEALGFFRLGNLWAGTPTKNLMEIGECALYAGVFDVAEAAFRTAIINGDQNPWCWRSLGLALLASGKATEADKILRFSVKKYPSFGMAHQNMAARYNLDSYNPQPLDFAGFPGVQLYDAYQQIGERHIHIGEGEKALHFFGKAIQSQIRIAEKLVIPSEIRWILEENYGIKKEESIRILPYEWITQIGHIAMLDTYRKLQLLGKTEQHQNVLLAPQDKVSNHAYLNLWRKHFTIIQREDHIRAIFPYQRIVGNCFNAFLNSAGQARCWTELGAEAHIEWDRVQGKSIISIPDSFRSSGKNILKEWGMKNEDWFVAIHVRSEGFFNEEAGSMQSHRNASISDYYEAINEITSRGGWVIRMGDPSMPKMLSLPKVIDYAHSQERADWMDVFLISEAQFFLGTTSGLTNAVISLGTPCILVNCISNYFQLWNNKVKFLLKSLWSEKERRLIPLSQQLKNDFRWQLFNLHELAKRGIHPQPNRSSEITLAVLEMMDDLKTGETSCHSAADIALKKACSIAENINFFGNAKIARSFYNYNKKWII